MTIEEAIEIITNTVQTEHMTVEQDRALATAQKALEKQIPKKPKITVHKCRKEDSSEFADYKFTHCPCCFDNAEIGYFDSLVDPETKYCRRCGQALDRGAADG